MAIGFEEDINELTKILSFISGFSLLLPIYLLINYAPFQVIRFHFSDDLVSIYITKIYKSMELSSLLGIIITCILIILAEKYMNWISTILNWIITSINILLLYAYCRHDDYGDVDYFYKCLISAAFFCGMNKIIIAKMLSNDVSFVGLGLTLSGIFVCIFQFTFFYITQLLNIHDIRFSIVISHILITIMLSIINSVIWTRIYLLNEIVGFLPDGGKSGVASGGGVTHTSGAQSTSTPTPTLSTTQKCTGLSTSNAISTGSSPAASSASDTPSITGNNNTTDNSNDLPESMSDLSNPTALSAMFMTICGLGPSYLFYPTILPYAYVDTISGFKIVTIGLFFSCIPSLVSAILSAIDHKYRIDTKWGDNDGIDIEKLAWIFIIPYYAVIILCPIILHYPELDIVIFIHEYPSTITILTVVLLFSKEMLFVCGISGVGRQNPQGKCRSNGRVTALTLFLSLVLMNIFMFIGGGYVNFYRKFNTDNWPTDDLSTIHALSFWIKGTLSHTLKAVVSSCSGNVRSTIIADPEPDNL